MTKQIDTTTKTTCPYCGVGCGVKAQLSQDGSVAISGDKDHPANFGRLCSKGSALGETLDLDDRLLYPEIDGERQSWDKALGLVADVFSDTIAKHGPDSVAFYVSGQLLTEDYYVANKLMKGFIGSANIDTNSRLCMASSVAGHRRAFGSDTVPGTYEDLEQADVIVLVGSNLAWCHPVLYQRIAAAKEMRPDLRVVLVDPRRTMTADLADIHLAIAPDGDTALFAGLLSYLHENDLINHTYVDAHTNGFEDALESAQSLYGLELQHQTDLSAAELKAFYELWSQHERVVTVYSQGVNQSCVGTDKVNAIINCHLATGRIGRPGMGPFSVTGQPNAMGGREVGGLSSMLAAHMTIEDPKHRDIVQRFWGSPGVPDKPGPKAVELFEGVSNGQIKALWIMATNPVVSLPNADAVETAIKNCPFVVVSDIVAKTDTVRHADVKLPSLGWGEKDGTVTNSERRISRQRAFLTAPGEAKADWWQIAEVAKRMGFQGAFKYSNAAAIFREYAAQTAYENNGTRDLDIGAYANIDDTEFDALVPFQWPAPCEPTHISSTIRFFANGGFFTQDSKANFVAVEAKTPVQTLTDYPLTLNTGRVRDHWHTMTRTGKSARLSSHMAEPFAELHPADAQSLGIKPGDLLSLTSQEGEIVVRALVTERQKRGSVFVPMHWSDQTASNARVDCLVPQMTDPISGQPAFKKTPICASRFEGSLYGFLVSRKTPDLPDFPYWARARAHGGWRVEFASDKPVQDPDRTARNLLGLPEEAPLLSYFDRANQLTRIAAFDGHSLIGIVFFAACPVVVSRGWAAEQLQGKFSNLNARWRVVAGRPANDMPDKGAIICACLNVGATEIANAVRAGSLSINAVGKATGASTNCGSCSAEIKGIINEHQIIAAE